MLPHRDSPQYPWNARPDDHSIVGLFLYGPQGETNPLALLIAFTYCAISAATPENERKQLVQYRARRAVQSGFGLYGRPTKPASSGRKRKVA